MGLKAGVLDWLWMVVYGGKSVIAVVVVPGGVDDEQRGCRVAEVVVRCWR